MTDKKALGSFIKEKRTEKNFSQKDLADLLHVTVGAVSKWERGISYPDITLISDICNALDISEHEFITASTDFAGRKERVEARKFRIINGAWFWTPTVCYIIALFVCFICNLAIDQKLSWFFIVFSALCCAFTFVPTVTGFFQKNKLLVFAFSSYLSICLLLLTCALYTNGMKWFLTAAIGTLIGYVLLFLPALLSKSSISRFRFVITSISAFVLTILLLVNIRFHHTFMLYPSVLVTCFAFSPVVLSAVIATFKTDPYLKAALCIALSGAFYYFTKYVVDLLFGGNTASYQVNFSNWQQCLEGNIYFIFLTSLLLISFIFAGIGIFRIRKRKNSKETAD